MIHWRDGDFAEGTVALSLDGAAFRFGAGLFETLYHNGRELCHLGRHLDRLHGSLENLSMKHVRLSQAHVLGIIQELISRNHLTGAPARINIYCFPDAPENAPCSVLMTARPHAPSQTTLRLAVCPEHHLTLLARHKTMNYGFHDLAQQQAIAAGYDGTLLTDAQDNILETTTSALVFQDTTGLVTPASQPRLPSTALAIAREQLDITEKIIHLKALSSFKHAFALNALMGMRPIVAIENLRFEPNESLCEKTSKSILCY